MTFESKELIFMCHPVKKAVGGVKVIYRHAELAHRLLQEAGHSASVMHPNTWLFRVKWFENQVPIRRGFFRWRWMGKPSMSDISGYFDPRRHLVVIPELWARKYGDQLARMKVPYAIFVQNGYYINKGAPSVLDAAYAGARCILTVSEDASRCVAMAFPSVQNKILRIHCFVDTERFQPDRIKENLITYMPRKLGDHSSKVLFFLRKHLPAHWRVEPIDGVNEDGVAALLQRSKIFMSFSHFEGLGLPPIEAALCGNYVIGYTGQGGKEYWLPDVFEAVEQSDVVAFAQAVLSRIKALDEAPNFPLQEQAITKLTHLYNPAQEVSDMKKFILMMGIGV